MLNKQKTILVTGAGGFIGSHLVETLVKQGFSVRAFVHYNSFARWGWLDYIDPTIKNSLDVFAGDIRDPNGTKKAMKGCNVVFNLAALIGIPYSYHSPDSYVDTNIKGTLNILQAARDLNIEKLVQTSTSEVYGTAQFVPITEQHPINPQSPYSATKSAADFLALSFYKSFETPVAVIRPFNTYGPRQSARAIIPTIISQIYSGVKTIKLGSLHPTRDLNFVADTVEGFIKIAEDDNSIGEVINIGAGAEISMGDLAKLISELMDKEIVVETSNERLRPVASEVERLFSDNNKAKELVSWTPKFTLKEGLTETIEWFKNSENMKLYKTDIYNI